MTVPEGVYEGLPRVAEERAELWKRIYQLEDALAFYADPDSYFAIAFWFDPPCGPFRDDFSDVQPSEDWDYERPMPGALARETLGIEMDQQRVRDSFRLGE